MDGRAERFNHVLYNYLHFVTHPFINLPISGLFRTLPATTPHPQVCAFTNLLIPKLLRTLLPLNQYYSKPTLFNGQVTLPRDHRLAGWPLIWL